MVQKEMFVPGAKNKTNTKENKNNQMDGSIQETKKDFKSQATRIYVWLSNRSI